MSVRALAFRVILTFGAIATLALTVDVRGFASTLRLISGPVASCAIALAILAHVLSVSRWRVFIADQPFWKLARLHFGSVLFGTVLPGQLAADVIRVAALGSDTKFSRAAISVFADRFIGLVSVALVGFVGALTSRSSPTIVTSGLTVALALLVIGTLVLGRLTRVANAPGSFARVLDRARLTSKIRSEIQAIGELPRQHLVRALLLGILFQLVCVGISVTVGRGLGVDISVADWCWVFGIIAASLFLPITIGGLGVREGGFVYLLGLFGVPASTAVALSLAVFVSGIAAAGLGMLTVSVWLRIRDAPETGSQ